MLRPDYTYYVMADGVLHAANSFFVYDDVILITRCGQRVTIGLCRARGVDLCLSYVRAT